MGTLLKKIIRPRTETRYIAFTKEDASGRWIPDCESFREYFSAFSNEKLEALIERVDGYDVVSCEAQLNPDGTLRKLLLPTP